MGTNSDPRIEELDTCKKCGRKFVCSKSGKCWCYEHSLTAEQLEEIDRKYDGCLCPDCMKDYLMGPER